MKRVLGGLWVFPLAMLLCSCAVMRFAGSDIFYEQDRSNVVIRFRSWDSISITTPHMLDGNYEILFNRAGAEQALAKADVPHKLAVIVCGIGYNPEQEEEQQQTWAEVFRRLSFERVVFLRGRQSGDLNGLPIIREIELQTNPVASRPNFESPRS